MAMPDSSNPLLNHRQSLMIEFVVRLVLRMDEERRSL